MSLIPNRFLVRIAHPCPRFLQMPNDAGDAEHLVELPESARLHNFPDLDSRKNFADVRLAWNEIGLGIQVEVKGKENPPVADRDRLRSSDGLTLWIDTRDARTSHRASRYCHQFHFLPAGGGPDREEPVFAQTKINRALQDAPVCRPGDVPYRAMAIRGGYRLEAFLPATVLYGFDPEQHPRLGVYYAIHDHELGDQYLGISGDFPFADDPSLWDVLELVK